MKHDSAPAGVLTSPQADTCASCGCTVAFSPSVPDSRLLSCTTCSAVRLGKSTIYTQQAHGAVTHAQ
jgi:hypothetical protein